MAGGSIVSKRVSWEITKALTREPAPYGFYRVKKNLGFSLVLLSRFGLFGFYVEGGLKCVKGLFDLTYPLIARGSLGCKIRQVVGGFLQLRLIGGSHERQTYPIQRVWIVRIDCQGVLVSRHCLVGLARRPVGVALDILPLRLVSGVQLFSPVDRLREVVQALDLAVVLDQQLCILGQNVIVDDQVVIDVGVLLVHRSHG